MGTVENTGRPEVAKVDHLVDENGARLNVPDDSGLVVEDRVERTVGNTGPTAWWRVGLIGIAVVVAILLVLQLVSGGATTDVVPGTPTTATQETLPQ